MELILKRKYFLPAYTIGQLYIGNRLLCDTMEPASRHLRGGSAHRSTQADIIKAKNNGPTAIPTGRYPVVITRSPRFGRWLPLLVGVPGFEGIRMMPATNPPTPVAASSPASTAVAATSSTPPVHWASYSVPSDKPLPTVTPFTSTSAKTADDNVGNADGGRHKNGHYTGCYFFSAKNASARRRSSGVSMPTVSTLVMPTRMR